MIHFSIQFFTIMGQLTQGKFNFFDERHYVSSGIGLRFFTPIGPLRFDFGWPYHNYLDYKKLIIHFSFGQLF